jgi:excisionase family DNA binding protein
LEVRVQMPRRRPPLDYATAAAYVGTTERHLRQLVYRRAIPSLRVGKLVRFLPDDLDTWLLSNRREVAS